MSISARERTLSDLYNSLSYAYVIPQYQRSFVWGKESIERLLDSINENKSSPETLFLGSIIFYELPNAERQLYGTSKLPEKIAEIVDGQQRMTAFALIAAKLLLFGKSQGYSQPPATVASFFCTNSASLTPRNTIPVIIRAAISGNDNYDVGLVSDLAKYIDSVLNNATIPTLNAENIRDALNNIDKWFESKITTQDDFNEFIDSFTKKSQIVRIEASSREMALNMFESLNSTSSPLTAYEVFRLNIAVPH